MTKPTRAPIPPSIRFEVFKRDSFTCQYCGEKAPDVVLHLDHIHPVAEGGQGDILNLITACKDCNTGKRDKLLSDKSAIKKQRKQLDDLNERRNQLAMMAQWREGLLEIEEGYLSEVCSHMSDSTGSSPNDSGRKYIRSWLKKFTAKEIIEATDKAFNTYGRFGESGLITDESWERAFKKIPIIAKIVKNGGYSNELMVGFYVAAILANKDLIVDWHKPSYAKIVELVLLYGGDPDEIKHLAKRTDDLDIFLLKLGSMPREKERFRVEYEKLMETLK